MHELIRTWLLAGIFVVMGMTVLTLMSVVFIPIFMAFFLSAVLKWPVSALMRVRVPRGASAALVLLLFCSAVVSVSSVIYAPGAEWRERLPELLDRLEEKLNPLRETLEEVQESAGQIEDATRIGPDAGAPQAGAQQESTLLKRVFDQARVLVGQILATVILTFFLLATELPLIPDRLLAALGGPGRRLRSSIGEAAEKMSRYMSTVSVINLCVGAMAGGMIYFLELSSPILWFVVVTFLNFIPYLGPVVSVLAITALSFLTFDSWLEISIPVLFFITIHFLEGQFVTPMVLGRMMTLHPVAILISVVIWGWMWGLAGLFLAVPILLTGTIISRKVFLS